MSCIEPTFYIQRASVLFHWSTTRDVLNNTQKHFLLQKVDQKLTHQQQQQRVDTSSAEEINLSSLALENSVKILKTNIWNVVFFKKVKTLNHVNTKK